MPQVPKAHVREALLTAALQRVAEVGYEATTLAAVAKRAGTSVGNLYKYFANKEQLFAAAVPPELVQELRAALQRRVESLGAARDVTQLPADHPWRLASREFLDWALERRSALVFLLRHSSGTEYAAFTEELVAYMVLHAQRYARVAYPAAALSAAAKRSLQRIYRGFFLAVADVLAEETGVRATLEGIDRLSSYHLAGLRAFFQSLPRPEAASGNA